MCKNVLKQKYHAFVDYKPIPGRTALAAGKLHLTFCRLILLLAGKRLYGLRLTNIFEF
jgi:hypothetical protein